MLKILGAGSARVGRTQRHNTVHDADPGLMSAHGLPFGSSYSTQRSNLFHVGSSTANANCVDPLSGVPWCVCHRRRQLLKKYYLVYLVRSILLNTC